MKVNNQSSINFGSRFYIRELPVKEAVTSTWEVGSLLKFSKNELTATETRKNTKTNNAILKVIESIKQSISKTGKIEVQEQFNKSLLLKEHIIEVDNSFDALVEKSIETANKKLKGLFTREADWTPRIKFAKHPNWSPLMKRIEEINRTAGY